MRELVYLVGFAFVVTFVYGMFYYILGRILMIFKSEKLRRLGHFFLAASNIASPVTIVKNCPRICNGKCKIWNCPLYNTKNCTEIFYQASDRIIREEEDVNDE